MSHSQFAMVCYEATIDPSEVRQVAHKNAKNQDKGMPRTKPSVLKRERELLPSHTPMQVNRAILQEAGGVSTIYSPVDMPASQQQIRDQSRKVPDSKRTTAAGRPAMNQYDKIEKQMSRPGSIVTDMEYFVTEKDTLGIRLFLCDPRGLAVMKSKCCTYCIPTVHVAEWKGRLGGHLADVAIKLASESANKTIQAAAIDPKSGHKGNYRRRGAPESAVSQKPIERVMQTRNVPPVPVSRRLAKPIRIPTAQEIIALESQSFDYREFWHNDHTFILVKLEDYKRRYPKTSEICKSCGKALLANDLVFVHYEVYWIPPTRDSPNGHYSRNKLRAALTHFGYDCLKNRYHYASLYVLRMDPNLYLEPEEERLMAEQFGVGKFQTAEVDWTKNPLP